MEKLLRKLKRGEGNEISGFKKKNCPGGGKDEPFAIEKKQSSKKKASVKGPGKKKKREVVD